MRKAWLGAACAGMALLCAALLLAPGRGAPRRPQEPAGALPYAVREVVFQASGPGGPRLAGTLTLPPGAGPHPAIVLVPGSGEVDRDGTLAGHRFYLVLADALTRRGFAVLRSDKRGLGASGGDFATATTIDFAADIRAALAFLRTRADVDARRIGLVGHSEGGLVGALVAADDRHLRFLVMLAGNGLPLVDMLAARMRRFPPAGMAPDTLAAEIALQRAAAAAAVAPGDAAGLAQRVRAPYLAEQRRRGRAFGDDELAPWLTPWMRTLLAIDPQRALASVRCPVLALGGSRDRVVTADDNLPAIARALAGNAHATVRRIEGVNHVFQTAPTGEFAEIAGIDETMAPAVLDLVGTWASAQARD